jgi:hypothetical protein
VKIHIAYEDGLDHFRDPLVNILPTEAPGRVQVDSETFSKFWMGDELNSEKPSKEKRLGAGKSWGMALKDFPVGRWCHVAVYDEADGRGADEPLYCLSFARLPGTLMFQIEAEGPWSGGPCINYPIEEFR